MADGKGANHDPSAADEERPVPLDVLDKAAALYLLVLLLLLLQLLLLLPAVEPFLRACNLCSLKISAGICFLRWFAYGNNTTPTLPPYLPPRQLASP